MTIKINNKKDALGVHISVKKEHQKILKEFLNKNKSISGLSFSKLCIIGALIVKEEFESLPPQTKRLTPDYHAFQKHITKKLFKIEKSPYYD